LCLIIYLFIALITYIVAIIQSNENALRSMFKYCKWHVKQMI